MAQFRFSALLANGLLEVRFERVAANRMLRINSKEKQRTLLSPLLS
jgi:hypothetical protein